MLRLEKICKNYVMADSRVEALKNIDLSFRKSEFVSILGPSGCGKTTLLNIIGGLDQYSSGNLFINGRSTKEFKDRDWDVYRNHRIGFIFQSYNLIPHQTILGNVELALTIAGIPKAERTRRAKQALDRVGLKGEYSKKPNQLSGGQCQRVAIARALVNEPEILLADEPTGALDTITSVQIMDLIKEIANDRLVIMVTHNPELAEQYSTRIIRLLDGKIVDDNNPFSPAEEKKEVADLRLAEKERNAAVEAELEEKYKKLLEKTEKTQNADAEAQKELKKQLSAAEKALQVHRKKSLQAGYVARQEKRRKNANSEKAKMSFWTSFKLSFQNLYSKKGRTILTALAGAIGIIGVSLVLAVSVGLTSYINSIQADALGGSPISVSAITIDTSKLSSFEFGGGEIEEPEGDVLVPNDPYQQYIKMGHYNNFTQEFLNHVKNFENGDVAKQQMSSIEYRYYTPLKLITENKGQYVYYGAANDTNIITGAASGAVYQLIDNMDYVLDFYDLIYGQLPQADPDGICRQMLLVVGRGNQVDLDTLTTIGITPTLNLESKSYDEIDFSEIINEKEYRVLFNDDYYTYDADQDAFKKLNTESQDELQAAYNGATETMTISGVLRIKEDSTTSILSNGLAYSSDFSEYYRQNCQESEIAKKQEERHAAGNLTFYDPFVIGLSGVPIDMSSFLHPFPTVQSMQQLLSVTFNYEFTDDGGYYLGLQQIGCSPIPTSITFYPKTFEAKDAVQDMLAAWNDNQEGETLKIVFADTSQLLTQTLGRMVNIVSYALIAFAAISLLVSCVMIGIITHVSVVERTKEIGIIRSLGGRKKDVVHLFNAETFIIGLGSGLIGILVTYIVCMIANAIVSRLAGIVAIAIFPWYYALTMVLVSVVLTLISGLIPSLSAAKKDPVVALRTE